MDEMIDSELVKKLRSDRSWSQEHLSLVSGLSLRTVQRVENEGKCSLDSKKAIASALDVDVMLLTAGNSVSLSSDDCRLVAALYWLSLTATAEYECSWKETDDLFQSRTGCADWVEKLKSVREPLGRNVTRSIKTPQCMQLYQERQTVNMQSSYLIRFMIKNGNLKKKLRLKNQNRDGEQSGTLSNSA